MKHLNKHILVNGWKLASSERGGAKFVHYGTIVDGESSNNEGNISLTYFIELYDEEGSHIRRLQYGVPENGPAFPDWAETYESVADIPEADKERPTIDGHCESCSDNTELRFVYGRDLRYYDSIDGPGEWHCAACDYTYHAQSLKALPRSNIELIEEVAEDNQRVADWLDMAMSHEEDYFPVDNGIFR